MAALPRMIARARNVFSEMDRGKNKNVSATMLPRDVEELVTMPRPYFWQLEFYSQFLFDFTGRAEVVNVRKGNKRRS